MTDSTITQLRTVAGRTTNVDDHIVIHLAADELAQWGRSFELYWKAAQRGTALWRAVNPGNDLVLPDTGEMVAWLIGEVDRLHTRLEANFAWQVIDGVKTKIAVEPGSIPDGIDCRDETIRQQDARIKELTERLRRPAPAADEGAVQRVIEAGEIAGYLFTRRQAEGIANAALAAADGADGVEGLREALRSAVTLMDCLLPSIDGFRPHEGLGLILDKGKRALAAADAGARDGDQHG